MANRKFIVDGKEQDEGFTDTALGKGTIATAGVLAGGLAGYGLSRWLSPAVEDGVKNAFRSGGSRFSYKR